MADDKLADLRDFHTLKCNELNMDPETTRKSWVSILEMSHNYNLDGRKELWLCCALYTACRNSVTETVGDSGAQIQGNCVSPTQILRACKVSIREFFTMMERWMDMNSMPPAFMEGFRNLETSFHTSLCVYNKFQPHFFTLFEAKRNDDMERRGKKSKPMPCSSKKLFEFAWCLFICAKAEYPEHSVDMVTSVNMLICCLDIIFSNVIDDKRVDIMVTTFEGCPLGWGTISYQPPETRPYSILARISEDFDADYAETSRVSHYVWRPIMNDFFTKNVLRGDPDTFLNIINVENFDANLKSMNTLYETYILSCGELDERIALSQQHENAEFQTHLVPDTPLSYNRQWVPSTAEQVPSTPVGNAFRSVETLRTVLAGNVNGTPDPALLELLKHISQESLVRMQERLDMMGGQFADRFRLNAQERFLIARALYYKMLEFIIRAEMKKFKSPQQLQVVKSLVDQNTFQTALIALCADIVIHAYNHSNFKFPWILDCFAISAFDFWRVIELVVRSNNDYLTRDILKHLTRVEEQIFEEIMWQKDSPIWSAIEQCEKLPLFQDVEAPMTPTSLLSQRLSDLTGITPHHASSNGGATTARTPSEVNRRLFSDEPEDQKVPLSTTSPAAKSGTEPTAAVSADLPATDPVTPAKPVRLVTRVSSLNLLFRKFYKLASVRVQELCKGLKLTDPLISSQIWTIFENSIVERTQLLKDRHLDQIIMCAIYVFIRVKGGLNNLTFRDIMTQYRFQPQSNSQVYRSVFIRNIDQTPGASEFKNPVATQPAEPNDVNGIGQEHGNVLRGDIILFYNQNYVPEMKEFAMRFATQGVDKTDLLLSPLPQTGRNNVSPKKIKGIPLTIYPLEKNMSELLESPTAISYVLNSPSKPTDKMSFQDIQKLTNNRGKRSFNTDNASMMRPPAKLKRIQSLVQDRLESNKNQ